MKRLLYISTARRVLGESALGDLLVQARRNNARAQVTGLLVVGGRRFLQVLEGPDHAVDTIFARIHDDVRHFATVVMADEPIAARSFAGWAMGCQTGGTPAAAARSAEEILAALVAPIGEPTLRAYFDGFVRQHARAA